MIVAFLVGVLLGSIPVAWILVRLHARRDVGAAGSGNVGALNALRVSRAPWVGVTVVVLDGLKGAAAVWLATRLGAGDAPVALRCTALVGAVAGHVYNPWLSLAARALRGGKGFATAAGGFLVFRPWLVVAWIAVVLAAWLLLRFWRGIRDEAPASAAATLALVPVSAWIYDTPTVGMTAALALVIGPKLVGEVRALLFPPKPPPA